MDIEAESNRIEDFVQRGNFHAAYNLALSALNACRRERDQVGVDHFIGIIRQIVDTLAKEFGSDNG